MSQHMWPRERKYCKVDEGRLFTGEFRDILIDRALWTQPTFLQVHRSVNTLFEEDLNNYLRWANGPTGITFLASPTAVAYDGVRTDDWIGFCNQHQIITFEQLQIADLYYDEQRDAACFNSWFAPTIVEQWENDIYNVHGVPGSHISWGVMEDVVEADYLDGIRREVDVGHNMMAFKSSVTGERLFQLYLPVMRAVNIYNGEADLHVTGYALVCAPFLNVDLLEIVGISNACDMINKDEGVHEEGDLIHGVSSLQGTMFDSLHRDAELHRLDSHVKAKRGVLDGLTTLLEGPKTVQLVRNFRRVVFGGRFGKRIMNFRFKDSPKTLANSWLSTQYGWRQLVFDATDLLTSIFAYFNKMRKSYSAGSTTRDLNLVRNNSYTESEFDKVYWSGDLTSMLEGTFTVHAGCGIRSLNGKAKARHLIGGANLMRTAWETIPYSFVLDWFISLGDYFTAMGNSPAEIYRQWTTVSTGSPEVDAVQIDQECELTLLMRPAEIPPRLYDEYKFLWWNVDLIDLPLSGATHERAKFFLQLVRLGIRDTPLTYRGEIRIRLTYLDDLLPLVFPKLGALTKWTQWTDLISMFIQRVKSR